jgi:hypothetical protein
VAALAPGSSLTFVNLVLINSQPLDTGVRSLTASPSPKYQALLAFSFPLWGFCQQVSLACKER